MWFHECLISRNFILYYVIPFACKLSEDSLENQLSSSIVMKFEVVQMIIKLKHN